MRRADFRRVKTNAELTGSENGSIINYKLSDHHVNIHNETEYGLFEIESVEEDLRTSFVGREALKHIEENGVFLTMNYDVNVPVGILGKTDGKNVETYANNCENIQEVADTLIHETYHFKLNWNKTQEDEINCFLMELMHRKTSISDDDITKVVNFVKQSYSHLPKGDLYGY